MKISDFQLERYFAKYEFSAQYLLSCSDCESLSLKELVDGADVEIKLMWEQLNLGYTECPGHPLLREEIAKLYQLIQADDCLVVIPEEGIFIAMNAILEKGDHVIVPYPAYQSLYEIAKYLGCEVTKWQIDLKNGQWNIDLSFLRDHIQENTKLIVCNFPHNPTGFLPNLETYQEIINIARERDIYFFSDEMYRYLEHNSSLRLPSASDLYDKAISLFGLSKTFGLPGLRIGWLTTQNKQIYKALSQFKDYISICSSAPSEILAIMALRQKETIIKSKLEVVLNNLGTAKVFFKKYNSIFEWYDINASPIAFPKLILSKPISDFCEELIQVKNTMLLPDTLYGYSNNHFRIGFGRKNFTEVLSKLEEFIQ